MPIDFSPLYAPTPESPTSRGLRGIGDALDAVVARRTQMEQARMQREQADAHAHMVDARVREQNETANRNVDENRKLREQMFGVSAGIRARGADNQGMLADLQAGKYADYLDSIGDTAGADELRAKVAARHAEQGQPDPGGNPLSPFRAAQPAATPPPAQPPPPAPAPTARAPAQAPIDEGEFQNWYSGVAAKLGINPNPDDPQHHYDYRAFYRDVKEGRAASPDTPGAHFPSTYKTEGHPRERLADSAGRIFDTRTGRYVDGGQPVSPEELAHAETAPDLSPSQPAPAPAPPALDVTGAVANIAGRRRLTPQTEGDEFFATQSQAAHPPSVAAMLPSLRDAIKSGHGKFTTKDAMGAVNAELTRLQSGSNADKVREGMKPGEAARLNEQKHENFLGDIKQWQTDNYFHESVKSMRSLDSSEEEIASGSPLLETGVRYAIGKAIAGPGVFTDDEQKRILGTIGGKWEGWKQMLRTWEDGRLNDSQRHEFEGYIAQKRTRIREKIAVEMSKSYRNYFVNSSSWPEFREDAIKRHNRMMTVFGVPDLGPDGEPVRAQVAPQAAPAHRAAPTTSPPGAVNATPTTPAAPPSDLDARKATMRARLGLP